MDDIKAGLIGAAIVAVLTLWVAHNVSAQRGGPAADTTTAETAAETAAELLEFETDAEGLRIFTLESLSYYDGTGGRPAYIAYNGYVYDVSEVWIDGDHHSHRAGSDFTQLMSDAPHGGGILQFFPVVGVLAG